MLPSSIQNYLPPFRKTLSIGFHLEIFSWFSLLLLLLLCLPLHHPPPPLTPSHSILQSLKVYTQNTQSTYSQLQILPTLSILKLCMSSLDLSFEYQIFFCLLTIPFRMAQRYFKPSLLKTELMIFLQPKWNYSLKIS